MKKAVVALGLAILLILGVSYAFAQEQSDPPRHERMHGEKSWGHEKRLNLTPEQKEKFRELRRKFIAENAQLIGGLVAKRLELRSLWSDPKADSQIILAKERELMDLQNRLKDKKVQYKLEARKSLTPEQIEKLGMMRRMGREGMMGHRCGMGHPGMWQ